VTANPLKSDYEPPALTIELHPRNSVVMAAVVPESGNILAFPFDTTLDTKLTPAKGSRMGKPSFRVRVDKYGQRGTVFWRREAWWLRFVSGGQMRRLALKTTDAKMAKSKAIDLLTVSGRDGNAKLAEAAGSKDMTPTIGAICEHYMSVTECRTAQRNVNCLLRVVARGKGWRDDGRVMAAGTRERVMRLRGSELTAGLAADYYRNDPVADYTRRTTLAGAKAVFARTVDWVGFAVPDISGFLTVSKQVAPEYSGNSFQHIPTDTLSAMERDSRIDGMTRKAFICCRYLGMTPKEVAHCRRGWIESRAQGPTMCVRERPDEGFALKTGDTRERDIVIPQWMAGELLAAAFTDSDFLIALPTPNLRYQWMLRTFNMWVRRYIPDRKGAAYELRKQAGTDWLEATGRISEVQHLLGHSTPTTTARWYAAWRKAVTVPACFQTDPNVPRHERAAEMSDSAAKSSDGGLTEAIAARRAREELFALSNDSVSRERSELAPRTGSASGPTE
jgi:integrase